MRVKKNRVKERLKTRELKKYAIDLLELIKDYNFVINELRNNNEPFFAILLAQIDRDAVVDERRRIVNKLNQLGEC